MNFPAPGDYIDIHNHGGSPAPGIFCIENLMAHEERTPDSGSGMTFSYGIHPWHLDPKTYDKHLSRVRTYSGHENTVALGEAGFDRLRGPAFSFQERAFEEQVAISEEKNKCLFIHCVKGWEELFSVHRRLKPGKPWIIHGFRGKKELARQLISRGMYLSFWFDFIVRPESSGLVKALPVDRMFLETDGSGADIKEIYNKVSDDLNIGTDMLKEQIYNNFMKLFG